MNTRNLLLASSAATLALALATPAHAGEVRGTVVDASDTIALQGAVVTIAELNRSTTADRDGSFVFADIPAGTYTLITNYVGGATASQTIAVPAIGTVTATVAVEAFAGDSTILVLGQSANQASALSRKRASDTVSDVLTRDAIGQFPDQNVAESLRRLPGVNVLNDQGEGRFVSIRGLDPELNSTSVNGARLPAPESDVRSVALDVVSSDIIESIVVKKSLTPDMDADTIGGSVEINTTSAFDRRRDLFSLKLEGSYNEYSDEITPKASFDFATRLTDNFGVSGGVSYYQRKFETDNIEADGWDDADGVIYAEDLEYRDYDVERERISASLNFDARLSDTTELYARGLFSQFDDQEYRRRTTFDFGDAFVTGSGTGVTYADSDASDPDEEYAITIERDIKDRFERQRIWSAVLGGETDTGDFFARYSASYSKASERENGSLDPVQFEREFEGEGFAVDVDYSDTRRPSFAFGNLASVALDPTEYELNDVEYTALSDAQDEEYALQLDLGREFAMGSGVFTVQGGAKARWRDKSYNFEVEFYELDDFYLSDVLGTQTYRLFDISPVADKTAPRDFFEANFSQFELQEIDSAFDSAVEDFSVTEDIYAGYLLGRFDSDLLTVIGGVRYERTENVLNGNDTLLVEEDGTLPGGGIATDDTVIVTPVTFERSYDHWLPSLNIKVTPGDDLVMRLAGYRSIVRPKLSALAPRFIVEEADDGEREGEFGNPDLVPYEAWNLDATIEYYMSSNGALTAGVFYKSIDNFIVDVNVDEPGSYRGIAFDEATIPINGESGDIFGIELGFAQALTFLPAPLDGFLVQANYTYTDARGSVPDGDFADFDNVTDYRDIALPASSENTFNAVLGYEKGPISLRLAGTYRDRYLDELGGDAEEDRYVDDHFQLDASAKVRITPMVQIYAEWINITDAKYFAYNTYGGRRNLYQYEQYGSTVKAGVKVNF